MPSHHVIHRVIQSDRFTEKVDRLREKYPRIDETIDGVNWLLSRSPEEGYIPGPPLSDKFRLLSIGPPIKNFYRVWLYYTLDEEGNKITLEDIMVP